MKKNRRRTTTIRRLRPQPAWLPAAACLLAGAAAQAAGHFDVDDAGMLDPGQCQVETWVERHAAAGTLTHVGPGCRAGPVELALNANHLRGDQAPERDGRMRTVHGGILPTESPNVAWDASVDILCCCARVS